MVKAVTSLNKTLQNEDNANVNLCDDNYIQTHRPK